MYIKHDLHEICKEELAWIIHFVDALKKDVEKNFNDDELIDIDIKGLKQAIASLEYWNMRYRDKEGE